MPYSEQYDVRKYNTANNKKKMNNNNTRAYSVRLIKIVQARKIKLLSNKEVISICINEQWPFNISADTF